MDLLFSIVRMGRTTFAELAPVLGYSAATMGIAGVSAEEYGAALAALTQAGMRTRTVSITLNAIVRGFLRPSKRSADLARKWGLALSATTLRAQGLTGVIRHLSEQTAAWGDRTADILGQIFPQIRGFRGIAAAIQNVDKYMDALNAMYDRGGEAMKAYSRAARGIMFNLNRIKAAIPMLLANIFDLGVGVNRAGSVLKLVADKLSAFVSALRDTSSVAHRAARDFLTFAKAIGIAVVVIAGLFVLGSLVGIIGSLIAVAAPLIGVATTILALFGSLFTAGSLFAGAVALVKGEIGDLTKALGSNLDVMKKGHKENLELIRELQRIRDLKTKGVTVTESLITVVEKLQRAYPGLAAGVDLAKVSLEDLNKILLESIKNARLGAQTIRTEARLAFEIAEVALKDYIGRLKDLAKDERKLEQERARRYRKRGVSWEEANYAQRARRARIEKALNSISKEREQILKKLARASREYGNAIKYDSVKALLAERDANEALALWLKSSLRIRKKSTKAMVVLSD
ncbi:MAG: phage tail tape measure protein, partial [Gammaproteobacteria bacterium]|nr:phage tail tape measure protein [Gammaproteobacteria bacterium]